MAKAQGRRQHNRNHGVPATQQTSQCKICKQELLEHEKEFYPCNCKYKVSERVQVNSIVVGLKQAPDLNLRSVKYYSPDWQ